MPTVFGCLCFFGQGLLISMNSTIVKGGGGIGAKPNLYCEAIELVCGVSPKVCILVEWKALDRVKSEL